MTKLDDFRHCVHRLRELGLTTMLAVLADEFANAETTGREGSTDNGPGSPSPRIVIWPPKIERRTLSQFVGDDHA